MSPSKKKKRLKDGRVTKSTEEAEAMSKLSPALKELINAPFSRPGPAKAPARIRDVFTRIAGEAAQKNVGNRPWVALSVSLRSILRQKFLPCYSQLID